MSLVDLGYYENNQDDLSKIIELLKELPLYTFYEKINNELGNNEETHNCNECNTRFSSNKEEESQLQKLCKSFCNIISKGRDFNLRSTYPTRNISCLYMNLWLYSNVIKITETFPIIEKFYTALEKMSKNPSSEMEFCYIKNFKSHGEEFKNFKYLYEFLLTYDVINEKISPKSNTNNQLYCKHIKENFRFYNSIIEICAKLDKCPYSGELGNIKKIFITQKHLSQIYSKCNYEPTSCKQDSNVINDIPCLKEKDSNIPLPIKVPDPYNAVSQVSKVLTYSIPSVATLTMLYKFTPLGSWLYSKIKRTNNMENNLNAENYYISHHNTRIEDIDPRNSSNNTY